MHLVRSVLRRIPRRGPRSRGQSLVEFAIILPVFMLFFGAVLDLGRIAAARVTVTNAAREGAFQAARTPTSFDSTQPCPANASSNLVVCRTVLEARNSVVTIAPADISVSCVPNSCATGIGNTVTVSVVGRFELVTPILAPFFGGSRNITFTATSTHQIETLPPPPAPVLATPAPTPTPSASASAEPTASPTGGPCTIPSAGFTYSISPSSGKAPLTLVVQDTSTSLSCGITSWFWTFGDGSTSDQRAPFPDKVYLVPGEYDVTLRVTNAAGSNTTGAVRIRVKP